jgi:hypothetical protein
LGIGREPGGLFKAYQAFGASCGLRSGWGLEDSIRRESNPHPLHWKCNAQPLCYSAPILQSMYCENKIMVTTTSFSYGTSNSTPYVEFANEYTQDVGKAVGTTEYAPRYILTDVNFITHPKTANRFGP